MQLCHDGDFLTAEIIILTTRWPAAVHGICIVIQRWYIYDLFNYNLLYSYYIRVSYVLCKGPREKHCSKKKNRAGVFFIFFSHGHLSINYYYVCYFHRISIRIIVAYQYWESLTKLNLKIQIKPLHIEFGSHSAAPDWEDPAEQCSLYLLPPPPGLNSLVFLQ